MFRFPDSVSLTKMDDEMVLLDSASGKYFGLNAVATRMVELLREGLDQKEVKTQISKEYQAPEARVGQDLSELLERLESLGLLAKG